MFYYIIYPVLGDGTSENPRRPDVPAGTSWVGADHGTTYLLASPTAIPGETALTEAQLAAECEARGLTLADVQTWNVNVEPPAGG